MNLIDGLLNSINSLTKRVSRLESQSAPYWVWLAAPLTSTSWDADAKSTTAKTLLDLSAVFSAPAGIKAIYAHIRGRDSGSAATSQVFFGLSPNNTADSLMLTASPRGLVVDYYAEAQGVVKCTTDGDVYYQILASGASTMDCVIEIWGYVI